MTQCARCLLMSPRTRKISNESRARCLLEEIKLAVTVRLGCRCAARVSGLNLKKNRAVAKLFGVMICSCLCKAFTFGNSKSGFTGCICRIVACQLESFNSLSFS